MMSTEISPQTQSVICRLYAAEWSQKEIAEFCSVARITVARTLQRYGIRSRPRGNKPGRKRKTAEKYAAFIQDWQQAGPAAQEIVAARYGYTNDASARVVANRLKKEISEV